MMSSMAVDRVRRGSNALWMATAVFALAGPVLTLVGWRDMIVADGLANVASGLAGAALTAQMSVEDSAASPYREFPGSGLGLETRDHEVPSQCSTIVSSLVPSNFS